MINDANDRKSEADAICNFSSSALMMMAYALLCVPQVFSTNLEFGIVVVVKVCTYGEWDFSVLKNASMDWMRHTKLLLGAEV